MSPLTLAEKNEGIEAVIASVKVELTDDKSRELLDVARRHFVDAVREEFLDENDAFPTSGEFVPTKEVSESSVRKGGEITGKSLDGYPPIEVVPANFLAFFHDLEKRSKIRLDLNDARDAMLAGASKNEISLAHEGGFIDNQYLISRGQAQPDELKGPSPVSNEDLIRRAKVHLERDAVQWGGTLPWTLRRLYRYYLKSAGI